MKIITEGWPDGEEVLVDEITCKYIQDADCTETQDNPQEIVISTRDGGGGKFINIKTESWSISDKSDLICILDDFNKRIS